MLYKLVIDHVVINDIIYDHIWWKKSITIRDRSKI